MKTIMNFHINFHIFLIQVKSGSNIKSLKLYCRYYIYNYHLNINHLLNRKYFTLEILIVNNIINVK